jgi:hypothetical protein
MKKLFLPFCSPVGLPSGYKSKAWGSVYPYRPFALLPSLPFFAPFDILRPTAIVQRRRYFFARTVPLTAMAGKRQILPADAWARSSVTKRKLEELVRDGLLRPRASRT